MSAKGASNPTRSLPLRTADPLFWPSGNPWRGASEFLRHYNVSWHFAPLALIICCLLDGCGKESPSDLNLTREPWAATSETTWPQIVLANTARFKGHTPLNGASSFLLRLPSGEVKAATALHLLGEDGGVEPPLAPKDLNQSLDSWFMHPRTNPDSRIRISSLGMPSRIPADFDWLLLNVSPLPNELPSFPLKLRRHHAKVGELVHVIAVSYDEPQVRQKVYSGKVTQRAYGDRFKFYIKPQVNITGFSGAPIIDDNGYLVGVTTIWFTPRMDGDMYQECGGEDVKTLIDHVENP